MLEASLLEENNLSDQKEILSDEEEIYSGTHNAGNAFKTVDGLGRFFLTREFLPRVSRNWDQVSTNGFLHRVPDGL